MVFYRKYRPQKFSDIVGQENVAKALLAQLEEGNFGHGYLFFGTRGTGKTSTARIFAKAVNCLNYAQNEAKNTRQGVKFGEPCNKCVSCLAITGGSSLDLIEIDAASNRGIDEIRDLREKVKLSPVSSRFKVYIIDEAHMLTNEAFNALLKTLEEPPAHAIFILATTEFSKLPSTIVSRLQKFNFSRASNDQLVKACEFIVKKEGLKINKDSLEAIAEAADGSFRDAVSILDQLSFKKNEIKKEDVMAIAKTSGRNQIYRLLENLSGFRLKESVLQLEEIAANGTDIVMFARQTVLLLEKILFLKIGLGEDTFSDLNGEDIQKLKSLASRFEFPKLQELMRLLIASEADLKLYPMPQIPLILAFCKYCPEDVESQVENGSTSQNTKVSSDSSKNEGFENKIRMSSEIKKDDSPKKSLSQKAIKDFEGIEKKWQEFLNKVRPINAHVVALLRSTKPSSFDGESLTLEVFYRFHKDKLEEPKIVRMLDEVLAEVMGKPIKLKFSLAKQESKPTQTVTRSDVVDIKVDELEMIAQEIFSK